MPSTLVAYREATNGFEVTVEPQYQPTHSEPQNGSWVWSYRVHIQNHSDRAARLLTRWWEITDGYGDIRVVEGPGVVGQTPRIEPGDSFEYHSGCPLTTPSGSMRGRYTMQPDRGEAFEIAIPLFVLVLPDHQRSLN